MRVFMAEDRGNVADASRDSQENVVGGKMGV